MHFLRMMLDLSYILMAFLVQDLIFTEFPMLAKRAVPVSWVFKKSNNVLALNHRHIHLWGPAASVKMHCIVSLIQEIHSLLGRLSNCILLKKYTYHNFCQSVQCCQYKWKELKELTRWWGEYRLEGLWKTWRALAAGRFMKRAMFLMLVVLAPSSGEPDMVSLKVLTQTTS